ncbi:hypothetical protein Mal4_12880 [Maioricimonas rarisocia]|uniref:Uncharacterized protein n=1 Tax=Maioricimonas rarisocia TaxID=2528026 RepID=A0A517Z3D7_9PLAN|nr:hypothetical protein [Maioricimonas rarisocia]QDU36985.1 hypothetical protein Mal4_12880 [Maioricimonas rarisocia]
MSKALRTVGGVVAGIVVALILLIAVEAFSAVVHPVPEDFDGTMEQMCQHVARYPQWVLAVVVPMWGAIAFISTWTAHRVGGRVAAIVIAVLLVAAVVFNVSMLPYVMWFKLVMVPVVAGAAAWACVRRPGGNRIGSATGEDVAPGS